MYNRYIPNGASYTRSWRRMPLPPRAVPPDAPPPEPDAEAPESAKPASGLGKLLRGLKLDGLDTGDVLLLLILLFLFLEGDDMELVITLGLLLLLGLGITAAGPLPAARYSSTVMQHCAVGQRKLRESEEGTVRRHRIGGHPVGQLLPFPLLGAHQQAAVHGDPSTSPHSPARPRLSPHKCRPGRPSPHIRRRQCILLQLQYVLIGGDALALQIRRVPVRRTGKGRAVASIPQPELPVAHDGVTYRPAWQGCLRLGPAAVHPHVRMGGSALSLAPEVLDRDRASVAVRAGGGYPG